MTPAFSKMTPLSEEQRTAALNAARMKIVGDLKVPVEPVRDNFIASDYAKLPPYLVRWINRLALFMLLVAFVPSAMRLHAIGLEHAIAVLKDSTSSYVAAICVVFMAEIGQVIFTLGATNTRTKWGALGMYVGAAICTALALTGNAQAVGTHALDHPFAFIETYGPPVLVLLTSTVLKSQAVGAIRTQHAAAAAFAAAHKQWIADKERIEVEWQAAFNNADQHHSWQRIRANALREALRRVNQRSTAVLRELTDNDWRALIEREANADQWFERSQLTQPEQRIEPRIIERTDEDEDTEPVKRVRAFDAPPASEGRFARAASALPKSAKTVGRTAGTHTRELDNTVTPNADGTHTATCPICAAAFTKETERAAKNALVAHTRHAHRNAQTENE